jgi:hypothetical protein
LGDRAPDGTGFQVGTARGRALGPWAATGTAELDGRPIGAVGGADVEQGLRQGRRTRRGAWRLRLGLWRPGPAPGASVVEGRADATAPGPGPDGRAHDALGVELLFDDLLEAAVAGLVVVARLAVFVQTALDHFQGQKGVPLLAQDPPEALDVGLVELAVTRGRPLRVDQALALEEADLRDGHVGELLLQEGKDFPYREMGPAGHDLFTPVPAA